MRWGHRGAGHLRMGGGHLPWVVYVLCVRPYWPPCRAPVGAVRVGRGGARVWVPLGTGVRGGCVCTGRPCGWWRRPVLPRSSPSFPCVGFRGRRCCSRPLCLGGDVSTAEVPCGGPVAGRPLLVPSTRVARRGEWRGGSLLLWPAKSESRHCLVRTGVAPLSVLVGLVG